MKEIGDLDSAFPYVLPDGRAWSGISVRDYFAAKAMQGFIMARVASHVGEDGLEILSQDAYLVADAMLTEGNK